MKVPMHTAINVHHFRSMGNHSFGSESVRANRLLTPLPIPADRQSGEAAIGAGLMFVHIRAPGQAFTGRSRGSAQRRFGEPGAEFGNRHGHGRDPGHRTPRRHFRTRRASLPAGTAAAAGV
jgi:hypothetical protein